MEDSKGFFFIMCAIIFSCFTYAAYANDNTDISATVFIQKFCDTEFNGVEERHGYVKFSEERRKTEEEKDPSFKGMVMQLDASPLFVVKSYRVLKVQINGNMGVATIEYERVARSKGFGSSIRKLYIDHLKNEIVSIKLLYDGKRWWIIDPPPPRVSIDALFKFYKNKLDRLGSNWEQNPSLTNKQKLFYHNYLEAFGLLSKLRILYTL